MNKTALITGASGEIGSAISLELAKNGYDICVGYAHRQDEAQRLAKRLSEEFSVKAYAVRFDYSCLESIDKSVSEFTQLFGGADVIVNNGGCESIGLFQQLTDERLVEVMNTDLVGAMLLTKKLLGGMIKKHSGYIINISSVWGEVGASCEVAYSAAKAGLIGFTKALAKECAPSGICVNCISPGFIDTRMNSQLSDEEKNGIIGDIPCCRAGTTQDIANTAAFLVSGKADYICGQVIRVDGGWI